MLVFANPLALLLAVPLGALAVLFWRNGYANLNHRRRTAALATRLVLIALVILAFADLHLRLPQSRQAVVFVADLSASDAASKSTMRSLIDAALRQRPSGDAAGVVVVGRDAQVEQPVSALTGFDGFQEVVDDNYTNLEGGEELAGAIMPNGFRRRVVLLSDGQQNIGDALSAARLLRSEGIRLDVAPMRVPGGPDVLVDHVDVPSQLRPQESFTLTVWLRSNVATNTGLDVYRDNALIMSRQEQVYPGENQFSFSQPALRPGFHAYTVHITPAIDSQPNNNSGSAFTSVQGPPRVLIIADDPRKAVNVLTSLRSTGIDATVQLPVQVVPTLGYLQRFAALVIVDTSADALGPDLMDQLVPFVRDLGHGLVVVGGQESYGMGGYGQTPLEHALPVSMDLPKRKDLPSAAVALIIESLESDQQINISKEAGKGIVQLLTQQDQVAVNDAGFGAFDWAVPLQHAGSKGAIENAIDQMQPGDPMSYAPYLQEAYNALKRAQARVKHIILLGDGDAEDPGYEALVRKIRAGGVTVSTVATNGLGFSDFQVMRDIATWGGGRYYRADDPASIPKIFLREARTVARSGIITGKFFPQELSANPMLHDLRAVASLYGYVATTPKPTGEIVLASKKLDPVLAGWQLGLGRAVAWTSDAAGLWTRDWLQAPGANRFWANLVSWTLPASQGGRLFIASSSAEGQGHIAVDVPAALGADPSATAHVVGPDFRTSTVQLEPVAPGRYQGAFPANAQGPYFITVEARGAGHAEAGQVGLDVPYSAEYRTSGANLPFLRELAAAGGGSLLTGPNAAWQDNLAPVYDQVSLQTLLILLALLLLPVDIGVRRLVLSRRDLAALRAALRLAAPSATAPTSAVAALSTLRARRTHVRSQSRPLAGATRIVAGDQTAELRAKARDPGDLPGGETKTARPSLPAADAAAPSERGGLTSSRLLAAKRRRK